MAEVGRRTAVQTKVYNVKQFCPFLTWFSRATFRPGKCLFVVEILMEIQLHRFSFRWQFYGENTVDFAIHFYVCKFSAQIVLLTTHSLHFNHFFMPQLRFFFLSPEQGNSCHLQKKEKKIEDFFMK